MANYPKIIPVIPSYLEHCSDLNDKSLDSVSQNGTGQSAKVCINSKLRSDCLICSQVNMVLGTAHVASKYFDKILRT